MPMLYELRVRLLDVEPTVSRTILVEDDLPLLELHAVLQGAFGWNGTHMFAYEAGDNRYAVILKDSPFDDGSEINVVGLMCRDIFQTGSVVRYHYDFGDDWWHEIEVVDHRKIVKGDKPPKCIGGENPCPPDDCGGPWGWAEMQEVLKNKKHPDHDEFVEWLEEFDLGPFDEKAANRQIKGHLKAAAPLFASIRAGEL